jgi:4-hydroxybenzoyl-CoA reductase subunit beta
MGTIGGNLCVDTRCNYYNQSYEWRRAIGFCMKRDGDVCLVAPGSPRCVAVSSSDTAPVMMALGATVMLSGPDGERAVPAAALYRDDGMAYLGKRPDEILTAILLPPANGLRSTYWKLRRRGSFDFPILGVAASVCLDGGGICVDARIVLGAVGSRPVEAVDAARLLVGRRLTTELIEEAAAAAYRPARPLDNTDLTLAYRKRMVRVFVFRALRELANLS